MSRKNENNNSVGPDIGALSGHLWDAANILRGPVDAADFKTYIFPLLFFKRLCDVYDEEYAVALEESGGDVKGVCRVVTLDDIRENDFNLNIPRYVAPVIEEESMTVDQAIANLKESLRAAYAAEGHLKALLQKEGLLR